nr:hypothetical protein [Belnapia rosea]
MVGEDQFEHRAAVLDSIRMPKFTRVCEEVESGSISFAKALERPAAILDALPHQRLLRLQLLNPLLIRRDDRIAGCVNDPVKQLPDLALDVLKFLLQRRALRPRAHKLRVPKIAEHVKRQVEQSFGRPETLEQRLELAFDHVPADRLPRSLTASRVAEVVRIAGAAPLRPAGRQRLSAMAAGDEPPQREIFTQILAGWHLGNAPIAALLDLLPGVQAHQPLMLAAYQPQAPVLVGDVARIDRALEHFDDALDMDLVVAVARIGGLGFEEALHFGCRLEPTRGIAFQGFGHDGRQRLLPHQQLAVTGNPLKLVANRRARHPIAIHGAGAHPVPRLLRVLLPLMLSNRRHYVFAENAVRILTELEGRAFQLPTGLGQQFAQAPVATNVTCEAIQTVDDDDDPLPAVLLQEMQKRGHPLSRDHAARDVIVEGMYNLIAMKVSVLAAPGFLAAQTVALPNLLFARHAAVDYGPGCIRFFHSFGSAPFTRLRQIGGIRARDRRGCLVVVCQPSLLHESRSLHAPRHDYPQNSGRAEQHRRRTPGRRSCA